MTKRFIPFLFFSPPQPRERGEDFLFPPFDFFFLAQDPRRAMQLDLPLIDSRLTISYFPPIAFHPPHAHDHDDEHVRDVTTGFGLEG